MASRILLQSSFGLASLGLASYLWSSASKPQTIPPATDPPLGSSSVSSPNSGKDVFDPSTIQPQAYFKYGFPGPVHDLAPHTEFISCYDRARRNPYWVLEHITRASLQRTTDSGDRKRSVFKEDESIPSKFRGRLRDYFRSGYDRGHQAPAADAKFSQTAIDETFLLSNMAPQVGEGFNRDYWSHFEDFVRRLTMKYDDVRVMTGPLYLPKLCPDGKYRVSYEVVGSPPNIAVPTHFFKLVVGEDKSREGVVSVGAFVLPNDVIDNGTPLQSFQVPVEALERSSGLELLQKVPYYNKKDLCHEVKCEIIVREFPKQVDQVLALPEGK
ncbi:uncharacterized protein LODBEIA_P55950 [Lodderomyces beijingensis]|uniref:Endonuclease n=1 Tax=Lodderomyces beijingensis TaxID=1775926 RepID=A0ABP0ZVS5_9ASCO